jgi:hypothetical protein
MAAIAACGGRKSELLRRINAISDRPLTRMAISQWRYVPLDRVTDVAKASGVPKWVLRPDQHDPPEVLNAVSRVAVPVS